MPRDQPLERVIKKTGGCSALARALGISPAAVSQWPRAPAHWLPRLASLSGVQPQELRPDLYGKDSTPP